MNISFSQINNPFTNEVFELVKSGLYPFVNKIFGWDDEVQQQRILEDYKADWFHWVYSDGTKIGLVCFKRYDNALHLHLIVIAEKHQNSGKGKNVMRALHDIARAEKRDISLSSFKCNERAVRLYTSLNYEVTDEEEHFIFFKLSSNNL